MAATLELLTAEELAERLRLSPHTVRLWSKEGRIPTVWLSHTVRRFDFQEVVRAIRDRQQEGHANG